MMKKILILGANGFIGRNLKDIFVQDKKFTIVTPTSRECDLSKINDIKKILEKEKPEIIINAAFKDVSSNSSFSTDYIFKNTEFVTNILTECIGRTYIKKVIHFGSAAEYGDSKKKISEDFPIEPKNIYATAKAISTLASLQLQREYDLPLIILRPFYLYGPHNNKGVLYDVMNMIGKDKDLLVTRGEQVRDYMYTKDLAKVVKEICLRPHLFKNGEIYNIGTGKGMKLNQVFRAIFTSLEKKPKISYREYAKNEYFSQVADNRKIGKIIKLKFTPFEKGIKETIRLSVKGK